MVPAAVTTSGGGGAKRNGGDEVSSIRLWPPGERTRSHVMGRMAENLKSLSLHYTPLNESEAAELSVRVEEFAFQEGERESEAAGAGNNGSSAVRVYAKQASKIMLEVLKAGGKFPEADAAAVVVEDNGSEVSTVSQDVQDTAMSRKHGEVQETGEVQEVFDITGGVRTVLDERKARELFGPLQAGAYTQIRLSDWAFTTEAALVAAEVLSSIKSRIIKADLSDIVAGRPEVEALEVMTILSEALEGSNLSFLDLSNNALGEKGVRAFGALLKSQHHLKELYFVNNGISSHAAKAIVELLPTSKEIKTLHFHNNMSGSPGAQILAKLVKEASGLEDFRFSSSRVEPKGGVALAEALKSGSSLRKLDLRDNMFGPKAGVALASALKQHSFLKEFYLGDLGMKNRAVKMILDALAAAAPNITILDLGNNSITSEAVEHIASCVAKMKRLTKLHLQENAIKDRGVVLVSEALAVDHNELEELDFTQTGCRDEGAIASAKAVVANKPRFKKLILESNHISDVDAVNAVLDGGIGSSVLVPMEDNNPEQEDDDDNEEDEDDEDEAAAEEESGDSEELQAKLGGLSV